jgi:hypothetical protein
MAASDQRARVLYRLPEQRRLPAGMPSLLTLVLLALVLFLGGLVVGRATMTRDQPVAAAPATTAAPATSPPATAAAGPAAPAEAAAASRVGPRRYEHGVGVGYARTREGAVAAAANFTTVLSSGALILDDARRRAAINTLAAPEARARLQRTFDQAVASIRQGLGVAGPAGKDAQVLLRTTPVGWRVEDYGGGTAKVAIWVTSVGGSIGTAPDSSVPVREGWGTTTVTLRWAGGDWKQVASTTVDGPVPIADVAPPTAAPQLVDHASEFKEFTYAPGP